MGRTRLVLFVVGSRATIGGLSETVARQTTAVAVKSWATLCIHQIPKAASNGVSVPAVNGNEQVAQDLRGYGRPL